MKMHKDDLLRSTLYGACAAMNLTMCVYNINKCLPNVIIYGVCAVLWIIVCILNIKKFKEVTMELSKVIIDIARDEKDNFIIDTVKINGTLYEYYETAIKHRYFNNNNWIILAKYNNEEEAKNNHELYVRVFSTCDIIKIINIDDEIYKRQEV